MASERCRGDGAARVDVERRRRRRCARTPSRTARGTTGAGWCVRASAAWSASWRCARSCWTWTSATSIAGAIAGASDRLHELMGTPKPTKSARAEGCTEPLQSPPPVVITHTYGAAESTWHELLTGHVDPAVWDTPWGRRFIARRLQCTPAEELAFTTHKIEQNFSNYSAWHYRTAVLPTLHAAPSALAAASAPEAAAASAEPLHCDARPRLYNYTLNEAASDATRLPTALLDEEFELVRVGLS
jgi:hypothetical protein